MHTLRLGWMTCGVFLEQAKRMHCTCLSDRSSQWHEKIILLTNRYPEISVFSMRLCIRSNNLYFLASRVFMSYKRKRKNENFLFLFNFHFVKQNFFYKFICSNETIILYLDEEQQHQLKKNDQSIWFNLFSHLFQFCFHLVLVFTCKKRHLFI